jgi:hypothetical protein
MERVLEHSFRAFQIVHFVRLRGGKVSFHDRRTFEPDHEGVPVTTFRAEDRRVVDLIAYDPATGRIASLEGTAFCLGDADQISNPATYFAGSLLEIHKTPFDWLRAGRRGLVILRPELAPALLYNVALNGRLLCRDREHSRRVARWINKQRPRVNVLTTPCRGKVSNVR